MEFSAIGLGELFKSNFDGGPHDLRVRAFFRGDARNLITTAEIQGLDARKTADKGETRRRDLLPDDRITSGPDVGMDAHHLEVVQLDDGLRLVSPLMPDAERGVGAADVGLARATRTPTGIEAQADLMAGERLADPFELQEGAGIHVHALTKKGGEIVRELLRRERNSVGGYPGMHGTADFPARASIKMKPFLGENLEHHGIRASLHGKSDRHPIGMREGQHGVGLRLKDLLVIDKAGGAMGRRNLAGRSWKKEAVIFHGGLGGTVSGPPFPSSLFADV